MRAELAIVAAMPAELAALRRRLRGSEIPLAVTGDGSARSAVAVCRFLDAVRPATLLGVGVAGGLTPATGRGELIVVDRIVGERGTLELANGGSLRRALLEYGAHSGVVVAASRIATRARDKQRLAERAGIDGETPAIVDLESESWARAALDRGIVPTIVRYVLDPCDESLPVDLERFQSPGGSVRRGALAAWLALRPWHVPSLLRLGGRVRAGGRKLGEDVGRALDEGKR